MFNKGVVLVTGVAGFIGFHQAKHLIKKGYCVIGLDNINDYYDPKLKLARLQQLGIDDITDKGFSSNSDESVLFYKGDILDATLLENIYKKHIFKGIIHLAAQPGVRHSIKNPHTYIDTNIRGFLNILELARNNPIEHMVYASSSSVYGTEAKQPFSESEACNHPVSLYGATKKANEMMAESYHHLYQIPLTGLRFFTVYGPWGRPDMAPMIFANAIEQNKPINVFNYGNQSRDFTYIDDICEGITKIYESRKMGTPHEILNIGNGKPVNLLKFIELLERKFGKIAKIIMCEAQPGDVAETFANTKKLEKLGYKPKVNLEEGITKFEKWFRTYYSIIMKNQK